MLSQVELRVGFVEDPPRRNQLTCADELALGSTQHADCTSASTNPGIHRISVGKGQEKEANASGNLEECRGVNLCPSLDPSNTS